MSDKKTTQADLSSIKTVGVIGAGQMGSGIAHVMALGGYDVKLSDVSDEQLEAALQSIGRHMDRQVERDKIAAEDKQAALARIATGNGLEIFKDCDLVIESVTEDEELKKQILRDLCPLLKPEAIVCSNTSSISITRLASITDRPSQFMGMHFMNPVPAMHLVELIRGIATEDETFQLVKALTVSLGKTPATAEDFPAFIVNRILLPMINEAVYTLYEGVGSVKSIDTALRLGANHPMG
ncbi:MAG: 3-hydroxyacyl-CoA dehydrogenase NAD-binding domain-containing protein, partial [Hyphomicrobiales bacterium]